MAYIGTSPSQGVRHRYLFTATSGQTTFSGADDDSRTLSYTDTKFMDVFLNGVLLDPNSDYTATTGTSVVLTSGASAGDLLEVIAFDSFSVFSGTFGGDVTVGGATTLSGDLSVDTNTLYVDSTNNRVGIKVSSNLGSALTIARNNSVGFMNAAGTAVDQIIYGDDSSNLRFYTNATERLRILSTGGITFNGDTSTANALDDYEEGTWTPTLPSAWATGITTYDAHYTKIGNLVHITMWVAVSGITGSFIANIGGLPFTAHAGYGNLGTALVYSGASTAITRTYLGQSSTAFNLLNNSANFSTASNTQVGASNIMANFTYRT